MDVASGTSLDVAWKNLGIDDKLTVVSDIVTIQKKLSSISFAR